MNVRRFVLCVLPTLLPFNVVVATSSSGQQAETPLQGPTQSQIEQLIQKWYDDTAPRGGDNKPQLTYTLTFSEVRIYNVRKGSMYGDGTPSESTMVWPVRMRYVVTTTYYNGEKKTEDKELDAIFFVNEFEDWTWRLKAMK